MGYWDDGHMDDGWGIVMLLGMIGVWAGLIALVVLAVLYLVRSGAGGSTGRSGTPGPGSPGSPGSPGAAEQILAERLARGEIDVEDYRARLAALAARHEG